MTYFLRKSTRYGLESYRIPSSFCCSGVGVGVGSAVVDMITGRAVVFTIVGLFGGSFVGKTPSHSTLSELVELSELEELELLELSGFFVGCFGNLYLPLSLSLSLFFFFSFFPLKSNDVYDRNVAFLKRKSEHKTNHLRYTQIGHKKYGHNQNDKNLQPHFQFRQMLELTQASLTLYFNYKVDK